MDEFLSETYERLISKTDLRLKRYLFDQFEPGRLTGIIGPRGVGKTTLMLQYIKEKHYKNRTAFYFTADSIYFTQSTLIEFIKDLYNLEGYRIFFIDEIHKYKNWNQEIKNLYDAFPDIKIIYSGSSMLEITQGSYDLSRRTNIYHLQGLSFREYLKFSEQKEFETISYSNLISNPSNYNYLSSSEKLMGHFKTYLAKGYYPFVFEDPHTYYERIMRIINKIIFEDIPSYYDLKTHNLYLFKKILSYLATIPPGELNTNNIAKNMNVAHQTITNYLSILESVGLIQMIFPYEGGNQYLRKPQKIFVHNTNLLYTFEQIVGEEIYKGTLRELYFVQAMRDSNHDLYYSKQADYRTKDMVFEIGGKNKTAKQLSNAKLPGMLIKDDILTGSKNTIPLIYLGFLY